MPLTIVEASQTDQEKKWLKNRFWKKVGRSGVPKSNIEVLQINLGRICNLSCSHCHVEASPFRTETLSEKAKDQIIEMIKLFPQIKTVDLTGGAPEMNYGFREIVRAAREQNKEVIVRSNLTIYFEEGYEDCPEFFAEQGVRVVASLPCYLEDNVDKMRGKGVFNGSIKALQALNEVGYGKQSDLQIDLVFNPQLPANAESFRPTAGQAGLEKAYKEHLLKHFGIVFNHLYAITNLPIGRFKHYLERKNMHEDYLEFLEGLHNNATLPFLMCKNQLSIDYDGKVYDCDFNQIEGVSARDKKGKELSLQDFLDANSLDIIPQVQLRNYCYGCTAGAGASCGGSLVDQK